MNRRTLFTPKQKGGLRLPDLLKYFHAAQLTQLTKFQSQQPYALWMITESYSCHPKLISHIMWLPMKDRPTILPSLSLSLGIWDILSRSQKFKSPYKPLAPLLHNKDFTLGLTPPAFEWWPNKGFMRIADLCDQKGILSKSLLIEKHQLPKPEHFRYTQIHHYL